MILEKNRVFQVWVGCRVPYSILTRKLEKNRVRMYGHEESIFGKQLTKVTGNDYVRKRNSAVPMTNFFPIRIYA